jgi:UDP-glucose 4-epimerase
VTSAAQAPLVAVTGAGGFVGAALCARLAGRGGHVRRIVRADPRGDDAIALDLARATPEQLTRALAGAFAVVHLAARVHAMDDAAPGVDALYRRANVEATERVALAAVASGVRRFVFASTVKVNGEATPPGRPFRPGDAAAPQGAYARSKLAAERTLAQVASGTAMAAVSLRLPLVYGAGARGNFRRLVDAVAARRFLPLGAIDNRRSLLGVDNLLDAIEAMLAADAPVTGTHFVADAHAVSTPALVREIAAALGVPPRLVPVPVAALRIAGTLAGRREAVARLIDSLEVDATSLVRACGWRPRAFALDAATVGAVARRL